MGSLEARLTALEKERAADRARMLALETQVAELQRGKQATERRLRSWRIAGGLLLIVGVLMGPPQAGRAQGGTLDQRVAVLEGKLARVSVVNGGADIVISGANLNIANGAGTTQSTNGLGNLVIGYNESRGGGQDLRGGSHNLVLGQQNNYSAFGGVVGGYQNWNDGPFSWILTGSGNGAFAFYNCIATGANNNASANYAAMISGQFNLGNGLYSAVLGGIGNQPSGSWSTVSGGSSNTALGLTSSVSGGNSNTASGQDSSVSGGENNSASGVESSVTGGENNIASNSNATVSGGFGHNATGVNDWRAGALFQDE